MTTTPFEVSHWRLDNGLLELITRIESFAPTFGYHVALTGGVLYKTGSRKDLDLLFYSIRQNEAPNRDNLEVALIGTGFTDLKRFGWMTKAKYGGKTVDLFFPETPKSNSDGASNESNP